MGRVLITDDSGFMRQMLRRIVESAGFEVVGEAENGKIAVEKYQELRPDLVTMDIMMPDMDGVSALSAIRRLDPEAQVVMVTASGQAEDVTRAIELGAIGYILKPFNKERILDTVRKALEQRVQDVPLHGELGAED